MKKRLLSALLALCMVVTTCPNLIVPSFASEPGISGQQNVVAVSGYSIAAVKQDGSLWAWGPGVYGQLNEAAFSGPNRPTQIMTDVISVYDWADGWEGRTDVAEVFTAFLKRDGSLWLIGDSYIATGHSSNGMMP